MSNKTIVKLLAIWKRLFSTNSAMEKGTFFQLRNVINRRNVSSKPKADVNAAEDFLEIAVIGYVISSIMSYLQISSLEDVPDKDIIPEEAIMDDSAKAAILQDISSHLVDRYVDLATTFKDTPINVTTGVQTIGEESSLMTIYVRS